MVTQSWCPIGGFADDEPRISGFIEKGLRAAGFATRVAATGPDALELAQTGEFDLLVLDGESAKLGGMGLCRQLKSEIHDCPLVLVLTGRPQDGWLATWSLTDAAVPHPIDPIVLADAVAGLARGVSAR